MEQDDWISICAHQLQRHWRTVAPEQLDEVAADLWRDEQLRRLPPRQAATHWLQPLYERKPAPTGSVDR
ncbi:conserved hypothetical protein [Burkholderiales bacterium 8X]|nr:conserved hypothetical protein [Burkholderiales bacterium 8X]